MIDREQLCALALSAIDSEDARVVLADAIEESGWWDERLGPTHCVPASTTWLDRDAWLMSMPMVGVDALGVRAEAVAAVLLFGSWPTRWELAERCRLLVPYRWPTEMLRRYRQGDVVPAASVAQFPSDAVGDA